jgi:prepilin-type N-terminal cleavage/methylation domain-containing protein
MAHKIKLITISHSDNGFSLVELSVVLVILGLLTGGILTGQSLIRAAELRSIPAEFQEYEAAIKTFEGKYFALPGDMNNATQFWGSASGVSCSMGESTAGNGTETCNGNGDGSVTYGGSTDEYVEMFMFWQHLANAGLVNGQYTGRSDGIHHEHAVIRTNVPASKFPNAGWSILGDMVINTGTAGDPNPVAYGATYKYPLYFGAQHSDYELHEPILRPEEAWNIDKKMDDGVASTGRVVMDRWFLSGDCNDGSNNYDLSFNGVACLLIFRQ